MRLSEGEVGCVCAWLLVWPSPFLFSVRVSFLRGTAHQQCAETTAETGRGVEQRTRAPRVCVTKEEASLKKKAVIIIIFARIKIYIFFECWFVVGDLNAQKKGSIGVG